MATKNPTEEGDKARVRRWFEERGMEAVDYPVKDKARPNPDFEIHQNGKLIGLCEVKSLLERSENELAHGMEPQKIRISNALSKASSQLASADPFRNLFRFVAIVNHDWASGVYDFVGVVDGVEEISGIRIYDQRQNPNRVIGGRLQQFDVVIGFYDKPYVRWVDHQIGGKTLRSILCTVPGPDDADLDQNR